MREHGDEARRAEPRIEDVAGTANTADTRGAGTGDVRPMSESERHAVQTTSAPAGALAGAAAGATAGLVTPLGPIGAGVGAVLGAVAGALAGGTTGAAAADDATWTEDEDRHYQALYEGDAGRRGDVGYDRVRGAYQFGHLAARHRDFAGRDWREVEPELEGRWHGDLRRDVGEWSVVRSHVRDAYGRARAEGAGVRRDASVIGSAGSAVDPVELREARAADATLGGTATHADRASFSDPVVGAPSAHSDAPGAGSPPWMAEPVDQGGFGARVHPSEHQRDAPHAADTRGTDPRGAEARGTDASAHDRRAREADLLGE
jgi:hypothetical protein